MTIPSDIPGSITHLINKWVAPYDIDADGILQYRVTNPGPDGVEGVYVTFKDGVPEANVGVHSQPDVSISMSLENYLLVATDELDLMRALMLKRATMEKHTPNGLTLLRHLGRSYRMRP